MTARSLLIVQSERLSASNPALFADIGDMAEMFRRAIGDAGPIAVVNPAEGEPLPDLADIAGAIIGGAAAMAGDTDPWINRLGIWLETAVSAEVPVLGICFGHQLLAHRLGGLVAENRSGAEYGTVEIELLAAARDDALLGSLPECVVAQAAHFETVAVLPPGAVQLAKGASGLHAARFAPACWGLQFHPEFTAEDARKVAESVAGSQLTPLTERLCAAAAQTCDTPQAGSLIRRFADLAFNRDGRRSEALR